MTGIYDCFGYGGSYDIPFEQRYKLIKEAGFDSVMLWWSDKFGRGTGYQDDVKFALNVGLQIENIHAPVHEQNALSIESFDGDSVFKSYLQCIKDCFNYQIKTVVIHLPNDSNPINDLGRNRLAELIEQAEKTSVQIAFENLDNIHNLDLVFENFKSDNIGFCYDSCHHINYAPNVDLLNKYGNRLMALHLHDNGGKHNQHQLPFDGSIDWQKLMNEIALTNYNGAITLEPMNWDYENLYIQAFLELAYSKAKQLEEL